MKNDDKIVIDTKLDHHRDHEFIILSVTGKTHALTSEELKQVFDPFSIEQTTLIDVGPCVAQKIINEHGGQLDVRTDNSGHVTFVMTLPVSQESEEVNTSWGMRTGS
jgi:K+-sensing histidine kinase KdpD